MSKHTALQLTTSGDRAMVVTRVFDAPRRLVFEAMSKAEFLQRWLWGPPGWTMVACESDLRSGGEFRHAWHGPDGQEMAMRGVYREVVPPERVVRTESFQFGCESQTGEQVCTLILTEKDGQTHLHLTVLYPSREARDATIASGMERGMNASYDRLDDLLAAAPAHA
jgi:uncharacterized protein YndB with AHSA1/START domain